MTPERWRRIEEVYHTALARPVEERAAFLADVCAGDEPLAREVKALLRETRATADGVFATPALAVAAQLMSDPAASMLTGHRLGVYQVQERIGAGGMGEVYRALDTRLGRNVAIKILPKAFTSDPDRLARFEREARVLASLNHPNIATIHGVEESDGAMALVMELVEGQTLAERLKGRRAQGTRHTAQDAGLPLTDALAIARQIAEALDAAHEKGIVHRDLKPANVIIASAGAVKVLDFGLAKIVSSGDDTATGATFAATREGLILGTAAYMSPEQARGQPVDKRTDIWAFGCVLYEMLTGRVAFGGETVSDVIAAILGNEPDLSALPAGVSSAVRDLIAGCLQKDRGRRVGDVAVAKFILDGHAKAPDVATGAPLPTDTRSTRKRTAAAFVAALLLGNLSTGVVVWRVTRPDAPRVTRTTIASSASEALSIDARLPAVAITPNGSKIIYAGAGGVLFVRALDALDPIALALGGAVKNPFPSPDGRWVGFASGLTLQRVAITGGPPLPIARISNGAFLGASWAPDHTIIFSDDGILKRVSENGGMPEVLTEPDTASGEKDYWPALLPGGEQLLFTSVTDVNNPDSSRTVVRDLRTGTEQVVLHGASQARYVDSGHLVFVASEQLFAVPFDLRQLKTRGAPVSVVSGLLTTRIGAAGDFAVGGDGTLVYVDASSRRGDARRSLTWVDRTGLEEPVPAQPRAFSQLRLSRDNRRVALFSDDQQRDVFIWSFAAGTLTRLTFDPGPDMYPVWTPDGRGLFVGSQRDGGTYNLWRQEADNTGVPQRLTTRPRVNGPHSITPNGDALIFEEIWDGRGRDLMRLALDSSREITAILQTPFEESDGQVSPDGRWLAYQTDAIGGRFQIQIRPFPNAKSGGPWQVSVDGGTQPTWAHSGKELFYSTRDGAIMSVDIDPNGATPNPGTPKKLFEGRYLLGSSFWSYDVSTDDQRFLMIKDPVADSASPPRVWVVQHWVEELKRLVPVN